MIKQYVNLPYDADKHEGNRVNLDVDALNLNEQDVQFTDWWVEPVGADNVDPQYLSRNSRAHLRHSLRRNRRGKFSNTLLLPHVGSDTYRVRCSKHDDRSAPVEVEDIQTWRKIYYTVHYMNDACLDIFNNVRARFIAVFKAGFIELEEVALNRTLVDEPNTSSSRALTHLYRRRPSLSNRPFHLRIVILNDIYDIVDVEYTEANVGTKIHDIITGNPLSDRTATHWAKRIRARIEPAGRWINIRRYTQKVDDTTIRVDISADERLSRAIDEGNTLTIAIETRERDHYMGHSHGNFCCVRINETGTPADIESTILQTFTHEIGHGFQQVVRRERLYNANGHRRGWQTNPQWHNDSFGGQGPHCSTNARLIPSSLTLSGQTYVWNNGNLLCTMFFRGDGHVNPSGEFCDGCLPRLRRANLNRNNMSHQNWNLH